jgi:hypothetical protein
MTSISVDFDTSTIDGEVCCRLLIDIDGTGFVSRWQIWEHALDAWANFPIDYDTLKFTTTDGTDVDVSHAAFGYTFSPKDGRGPTRVAYERFDPALKAALWRAKDGGDSDDESLPELEEAPVDNGEAPADDGEAPRRATAAPQFGDMIHRVISRGDHAVRNRDPAMDMSPSYEWRNPIGVNGLADRQI